MESLLHHLIDMNKKRNLENLLNNIYDKKLRGAQIRSKVIEGEQLLNIS